MGDFYEILASHEKYGGRSRSEKQMEDFRYAVCYNSLHELGWKLGLFTWSNKHEGSKYTKEMLDRVLADTQWKDMFRRYDVETLTTRRSDD